MIKLLLAILVSLLCLSLADEHLEALTKLKNLRDTGLIEESEYKSLKSEILDSYLRLPYLKKNSKNVYSKRYYAYPQLKNVGAPWKMNVTVTPQVHWLLSVFNNGLPRSYDDILPSSGIPFWHTATYLSFGPMSPYGERLAFDSEIAVQERSLTKVGLNLYDGSVWGLALALNGLSDVVDIYHRGVLYTSSTGANPEVDGLVDIRADKEEFLYGRNKIPGPALQQVTLPFNQSYVYLQDPSCCGTCCAQTATKTVPGALFYRMIGPGYRMQDPLVGNYGWTWRSPPAGPNNDTTTPWNLAGIIHWNDWKPITGENVWAAILGPMQILWIRNCTKISTFTTFNNAPNEIQLALSVLPALAALQSPLGSLYHCPQGTEMFPPDSSEATNVSNENNFSAYAAFKALLFILQNFYIGGADPTLNQAISTVQTLINGLDNWFSIYLPLQINNYRVISQGGHVTFDGRYIPQDGAQAFAVDCQTWGLTVVGQKFFDSTYGPGAAMGVWRNTKALGGYYVNGALAGVGYTVNNVTQIWSGEWTYGAINMCRKLAAEYRAAGFPNYAAELEADMNLMIDAIESNVVPCSDGTWCGGGLLQEDGSFLYANRRFFIPWGWYANPIGATASTGWAVFNDYFFNPFELGGGNESNWMDNKCEGNMPDPALLQKLKEFYN